MAFNLTKPFAFPSPAERAGFAVPNHEIIISRIHEIAASRETLQRIIPLPKSAEMVQETAISQGSRILEQNAQIELPTELVQATNLVAWAKQAKLEATTDEARQIVAQAFVPGVEDVAPEVSQPLAEVTMLPVSPEIVAAQEAVEAAQISTPADNVVPFLVPTAGSQADDDVWKAAS